MDLFLIRHAEAVPHGDPHYSEDERPLTASGVDQAHALAAALKAHGVRFDRIVSSPLPRARQTAEALVGDLLEPNESLQFSSALVPGGRRKKLDRLLLGLDVAVVAVVGHQPDLGAYAARLVGSKKSQVEIAKGGFAHIRCDDLPSKGCGTLMALVTPDWLGGSALSVHEGQAVAG
jgi:phosphohistidine phosphatase